MNWAEELAVKNNCTKQWVYLLSRRLGRKATQKDLDIAKIRGVGRPLLIEGRRYPNRVKLLRSIK